MASAIRSLKSVPEEDAKIWDRILATRRADCRKLGKEKIEGLLTAHVTKNLKIPSDIQGCQRIDWVLDNLLYNALNDKIPPLERRGAYLSFKMLLTEIEKLVITLPRNREIPENASIPVPVRDQQNGVSNTETQNQNATAPPAKKNTSPSSSLTSKQHATASGKENTAQRTPPASQVPAITSTTVQTTPGGGKKVAAHVGANGTQPPKNNLGTKPSTQSDSGSRRPSQTSETAKGKPQGSATVVQNGGSSAWAALSRKERLAAVGGGGILPAAQGPSKPASTQQPDQRRASAKQRPVTTTVTEVRNAASIPKLNGAATANTARQQPVAKPATLKVSERQSSIAVARATPAPVTSSSNVTPARLVSASSKTEDVTPTTVSRSTPVASRAGAVASINSQGTTTAPKAKAAPAKPKPFPKLVVPLIPTVPQPTVSKEVQHYFRVIDKSHTGALEDYPDGSYIWKQPILTDAEIKEATRRLYVWEPYWEMIHIRALTKTSRITKVERQGLTKFKDQVPIKPNCAAALNVSVPVNYHTVIKGWNVKMTPTEKYKHGDVRLLLHAIPCKVVAKPKSIAALKKMRSDSHEWPKGTLLMTEGYPRLLTQRKQQGHDSKEWSYKSTMLDLTQYTRTPEKVEIYSATFDSDSYYLCAAVCRYRAPDKLYQTLWDNSIEKVSLQDAMEIAKGYAKKNAVCCLDDVDDDDGAPSSFIFKLTCPLQGMLKTPVRARHCDHFQCFDLSNFLATSVNIGAGRWECPVCGQERISVYDLQHCGLTAHLLEQYKDKASIFQERVQFMSDGAYKLMPEKRKRYASTDGKGGDKKRKAQDEVILSC